MASLFSYNNLTTRQAKRYTFVIAVLLVIISSSSFWYRERLLCTLAVRPLSSCPNQTLSSLEVVRAHKNIAVAGNVIHFDVFLALVWSFERVMKAWGYGSVQVYASHPFRGHFEVILD